MHVQDALAALERNSPKRAQISLKAAMEIEPTWAEPHFHMARTMQAMGDIAGAERAVRLALEADPSDPASLHMLGATLCLQERFAEALPLLQNAVVLAPDSSVFQRDLGVVQLFFGDTLQARKSLGRALALNPHADSVLTTLIRMTKMDSGEAEAEGLFAMAQSQAQDAESLPLKEQVQLYFALGKALEDRGDMIGAFSALEKANRLHRTTMTYDVSIMEQRFAAIEERFSADLFDRFADPNRGLPDKRPIFVVGMPRSGTTLVEQIISAHPTVYGAGELPLLGHIASNTAGPGGASFPAWVSGMTAADLCAVGKAILEALPRGLPGQTRLSLKRLEDFQYIGLIHLCLPNATIIHCRRDPRDTCFSAYSIPFLGDQLFSYTFDELGRYWRAYDRLMRHWQAVLPPGRVLDAPYEALVEDQEGWTHKLLDHCALEWDEACLNYQASRRIVRSASMAQVRKPIYKTSIGRWKPFAENLKPLFDILGEPWSRVEDAPNKKTG